MLKYEERIQESLLGIENEQSDVLAFILENDPLLLQMFLKLWMPEKFDFNNVELKKKFEIKREDSKTEGRYDIVFESVDFIFKLEVKRMGRTDLDDKSVKSLNRYLSEAEKSSVKTKIGLLFDNLEISKKEIIDHPNFTKTVPWKDVVNTLSERINKPPLKLFPPENVLFMETSIIQYFKEKDKTPVDTFEPINLNDFFAFSMRNVTMEKFKKMLEKTVSIRANQFLNFKITARPFQDAYGRYGLNLEHKTHPETVRVFFGFLFPDITNGSVTLYSFIESNPIKNEESSSKLKDSIRASYDEIAQTKKLRDGWYRNSSDTDWQIVQRVSPFTFILNEPNLDKQIDLLNNWFDECQEVFQNIFKKVKIDK
ncbi:MAG: hypothetical protein KGZ58_08525 [Ignavibacteriales bacterium]|nr:hypothetical protein [Ignavibacteriales bacterium]